MICFRSGQEEAERKTPQGKEAAKAETAPCFRFANRVQSPGTKTTPPTQELQETGKLALPAIERAVPVERQAVPSGTEAWLLAPDA
jgi:hypothetical protein